MTLANDQKLNISGDADLMPIPPAVARQAIAWLIDLQADTRSETTLAAFLQWRTAHPDHERAWLRIESVDQRLAALAARGGGAVAHATLATKEKPKRRNTPRTPTLTMLSALMLGAVLACLAQETATSPANQINVRHTQSSELSRHSYSQQA